MLQTHDPTLEDFRQLEGCNEVLKVTPPDIVRSVHAAYFDVGVDHVETNTFGANHAALSELAEYWHARVSLELGIDGSDPAGVGVMFRTEYQGGRGSLGYPACPDPEDRAKVAALLRSERIGVPLSEEFRLHPEQSTDIVIVHHPEAGYLNAGGRT
jgi:cobalamin-dependent methionine synthase I